MLFCLVDFVRASKSVLSWKVWLCKLLFPKCACTHTHIYVCICVYMCVYVCVCVYAKLLSVQFRQSVMAYSLWPHELQHARPPCPSPKLEFTQTHAHRVGDAIQPSYPLSPPCPPAPSPSQHHGLFQWVNSSYEVAKVLEFQLQRQSFQWTPRTDLL